MAVIGFQVSKLLDQRTLFFPSFLQKIFYELSGLGKYSGGID